MIATLVLSAPRLAGLREQRLKKACDLLHGTEQGISEIASQVGYSNAAAFATAFKERYTVTLGVVWH